MSALEQIKTEFKSPVPSQPLYDWTHYLDGYPEQDYCWWCFKPAPTGVCIGPHRDYAKPTYRTYRGRWEDKPEWKRKQRLRSIPVSSVRGT